MKTILHKRGRPCLWPEVGSALIECSVDALVVDVMADDTVGAGVDTLVCVERTAPTALGAPVSTEE